MLVGIVSCTDDLGLLTNTDGEIKAGDEVMFTTSVPKPVAVTRALNTELLKGYKTIANQYDLKVTMLRGNNVEVGTGNYKPVTLIPIEKDEDDIASNYDQEGTLKADGAGLTWQTSTERYAFESTAGTDAVETDQSTPGKWLRQDRLHGYAFSPYEPEDGTPADRIDAPNYHTSKEWYQLNKAWHDADGQMMASEDYKKVPLFLQHQRSWITIILKASKGVKREAVEALYDANTNTYNPNVTTSIFSYTTASTDPTAVDKTLVGSAPVEYQEDVNGGIETRDNLRFDAIVEPHNYLENPKDDKIAAINLSNMHFSFYASNDIRFSSANAADIAAMEEAYNLTPGKHLTIEATLSTDRIVFITAWIEDWTEVVTSTICDDYGQNGDPTVIKCRKDLIEFLKSSELNKAGNVAIIASTELELDSLKLLADGQTTPDADPWSNYNGYTLNATLNLAGATLKSSARLFSNIGSTGNLLHGTIVMNNTSPITSAIAQKNGGTIDNIALVRGSNSGTKLTRAGFVEENNGYILSCSSSIPVYTDEAVIIGGIAAKSIMVTGGSQPTIDHCTMYASVKGGKSTQGGGIVGEAEGRLTNNTFDYGITLSQAPASFKNIIFQKKTDGNLIIQGNSWPTIAENDLAGDNASSAKYHNVLDCQEELATLLSETYNIIDNRYRIANDFTVMAESWNHGKATEDITTKGNDCGGNIYCEIDGNGKTITLATNGTKKVSLPTAYNTNGVGTAFEEKSTVAMLFSNITGYVHDMTIELSAPLIAKLSISTDPQSVGTYTSIEAIAPLAYSVCQPQSLGSQGTQGNYGVVRNVNVKMADNAYVQAATAGGLVCWAHRGGVVDNCNVKGSVLSWTPNNHSGMTDATRYVGGIVACAANATLSNNTYYGADKTLTIAQGSGEMKTYYGGILGGTTVKDISGSREEPQVSLIDNASWYQTTFENSDKGNTERRYRGAILGFSHYLKDAVNTLGTVMEGTEICQGNWWQADMDGVAQNGLLNGYNIETTIGRRNAVTPPTVDF